ncbi:MAG: hypothetical protein K8R89_01630 [Anaerolineae bacterium]|nr:hypothetical protein [Anaerolineae bacterium]
MKITDLRKKTDAEKTRVVATVSWENCDRPTRDIYFEVPARFSEGLSADSHAFLIAALLPAMRNGEERIALEAKICPELREGLLAVMSIIRGWYTPTGHPLVRLETERGARLPAPHTSTRAGVFLSGGVDSLALLRSNRRDYPLAHPHSFKDGLLVHGFDIGAFEEDPESALFEQAHQTLAPVARAAGITLIPVETNIRHLDSDINFWMYEFHGAALAAVAHAFSNRLTSASIASSVPYYALHPWGSHPLVDPRYSSSDIRICHENARFSRLEKVQLIANWDVALQNLRVCAWNPPGRLNCGQCDKCLRTMIELLAVGKLAQTRAFPLTDISEQLLKSTKIIHRRYDTKYYQALIAPLKAQGRADLATVIENKLAKYERYLAWEEERDWKGWIKRFDRRYLGSHLFKSYQTVRQRIKGVGREC